MYISDEERFRDPDALPGPYGLRWEDKLRRIESFWNNPNAVRIAHEKIALVRHNLDEEGADRIKDKKAMHGMPKNSGEYEPQQSAPRKKTPKEREASIRRHCSNPKHKNSQYCLDHAAGKG